MYSNWFFFANVRALCEKKKKRKKKKPYSCLTGGSITSILRSKSINKTTISEVNFFVSDDSNAPVRQSVIQLTTLWQNVSRDYCRKLLPLYEDLVMHGGCPKPSNLTQKSGFRRNSVLFASAKVKINVFLIVLNGAISQRGLREFKKNLLILSCVLSKFFHIWWLSTYSITWFLGVPDISLSTTTKYILLLWWEKWGTFS